MYKKWVLNDKELIDLLELELNELFYNYIFQEDLDLLGEPPINEFITERDLMIEI